MKNIAIVLSIILLAGCVTEVNETRSTLVKSGFTDIQTTGTQLFSCGEHDKAGMGFVATNPQGLRVSGVVCCGVWKSCTVRF